jgi:hypothetical protein
MLRRNAKERNLPHSEHLEVLTFAYLRVPLREALIRVPLREGGGLGSCMKALLQVRIAIESSLDFRKTVA